MKRRPSAIRFSMASCAVLLCCVSANFAATDIADFLWKSKRAADRIALLVGKAQRCSYENDTARVFLYQDDYSEIRDYLPRDSGDTSRAQERATTLKGIEMQSIPGEENERLLSMIFSDNLGNVLPQKRPMPRQNDFHVSGKVVIRFIKSDDQKSRFRIRIPAQTAGDVASSAFQPAVKTVEGGAHDVKRNIVSSGCVPVAGTKTPADSQPGGLGKQDLGGFAMYLPTAGATKTASFEPPFDPDATDFPNQDNPGPVYTKYNSPLPTFIRFSPNSTVTSPPVNNMFIPPSGHPKICTKDDPAQMVGFGGP